MSDKLDDLREAMQGIVEAARDEGTINQQIEIVGFGIQFAILEQLVKIADALAQIGLNGIPGPRP